MTVLLENGEPAKCIAAACYRDEHFSDEDAVAVMLMLNEDA